MSKSEFQHSTRYVCINVIHDDSQEHEALYIQYGADFYLRKFLSENHLILKESREITLLDWMAAPMEKKVHLVLSSHNLLNNGRFYSEKKTKYLAKKEEKQQMKAAKKERNKARNKKIFAVLAALTVKLIQSLRRGSGTR